MVDRDVAEAKITFKYKGIPYRLEISKYSLEHYLDVDYDRECGSYNEDCDHDYNRCMVIVNIQKEGFRTFEFCKNNLTCLSPDQEADKDILEQLCHSLSSMSFEDYIECEAEGDYYGDTLKQTANVSEAVTKMVECLQADFQDVVAK